MKRRGWFIGGYVQQGFHFLAVRDVPLADTLVVFAEDTGGTLDLSRFTLDFEVAIVEMRCDPQSGFKKLQVFVEGPEELVDAPGDSDSLLHLRFGAAILRRAGIKIPSN